MRLRSMRSKDLGKPSNISKKEARDRTQPATTNGSAASSFATALDIILITQKHGFLDKDSSVALRLTCKATRSVVDYHVQSFHCFRNDEKPLDELTLPKWPWPNINEMALAAKPSRKGHKGDLEHLVTLPLLKLKCLRLYCQNVAPLVENNWPLLTKFKLVINPGGPKILRQADLQFPKWHLKSLELNVRDGVGSRSLHFLGPLLKSSPELTSLTIEAPKGTKEIANMIVSASLAQLEELEVIESDSSSGFFETLLGWSWPALKRILIDESINGTMYFLASQSWITNIVEFDLRHLEELTAAELHTFLKALENAGAVEKIALENIEFSILLEGFKDISLGNIKNLEINCMTSDVDWGVDVSDTMNGFFDGCYFPKLQEIALTIDLYDGGDIEDDPEMLPKWTKIPSVDVTHLVDSFPQLKEINFDGLWVSRCVADLLGNFSRQTGCKIYADRPCHLVENPLSPKRQQLLRKLGIDFENWAEYTRNYHLYQQCMYWNTCSDDNFELTAYASALDTYEEDDKRLKDFSKVIQAGLKGGEKMMDALKNLQNRLEDLFPESECFSWHGGESQQIRINMNKLIKDEELRIN